QAAAADLPRPAAVGPAPEDRQGHRQAPQLRLADRQPGLFGADPLAARGDDLQDLPFLTRGAADVPGGLRRPPAQPTPPRAPARPAEARRPARRAAGRRTIEIDLPASGDTAFDAAVEDLIRRFVKELYRLPRGG